MARDPGSVGAVTVCVEKCWSCRLGQCVYGEHPMWDETDVENPTSGDPPPARLCGCPCATEPALEPEGPDFDAPAVSLNATPCLVCGEGGACGYDSEGRAMLHLQPEEPDGA